MDPPDLLSVELSTSRPTQHLGRVKSKSPPTPWFPCSLATQEGALSSQDTLSLLFFSGDSWVRAAGGTAVTLALTGRGVEEGRQLYPPRWASSGWSCISPARLSFLLPPSSTACSDPGFPLFPLILLSSPEPKPPHGLHLSQEPHPSPGSCPVILKRGCPHPSAHFLPYAVGFVYSLTPIHFSLSSHPLTAPFPLSFSLSLSLQTLSGSVSLSCLLSCLVTLFSCPHGLSCRGASTSPTSACHLHSE